MITSVNGKLAEWNDAIREKWGKVREHEEAPEGPVKRANYFTRRSWKNEYDRGSLDEGFVYTIRRDVWRVTL